MLSKPHKTHVCPYLIIFLNLSLKITESNDLFLNYLKISVIKLPHRKKYLNQFMLSSCVY